MSLTKFAPVFVIWEDAHSIDHWTDVSDIPDEKPTYIYSAGFLIEDRDDRLTLALNHDLTNDSISCVMVIPKDMVRAIVSLDK
jgi:hypothetical protein